MPGATAALGIAPAPSWRKTRGGPIAQATANGVVLNTIIFIGALSNGESFALVTATKVTYTPIGDPLAFSVTNLPSWASFNTVNGLVISGTPGPGDAGVPSPISPSQSPTMSMRRFSRLPSIDVNGPPSISVMPQSRAYPGAALLVIPVADDPGKRRPCLYGQCPASAGRSSIRPPVKSAYAGPCADANLIQVSLLRYSTRTTITPVALPTFSINVNALPTDRLPPECR